MINFDPFITNLSSSNLIEASAGTGKTHLISLLYLRFLFKINIEKKFENLNIDNLVIVTFTDLAVLEIKNRIINIIRDLKISCIKGFSVNEKVNDIYKNIKDINGLINLLNLYEQKIEYSSILTIHSFFKKILFTNYFLSKLNINYKILESEDDFIYKYVLCFWRSYFYNLPLKIINIIISYWSSPRELFISVFPFFNFININFKYKIKYISIESYFLNCLLLFDNIKKEFFSNRLLLYKKIIFLSEKNLFLCKKKLLILFENINLWLNSNDIFNTPKYLFRIGYKYISKYISNINFLKKYSIFKNIDNFLYEKGDFYNFILILCFNYIKNKLYIEKKEKLYLSFNDLIYFLNKSIISNDGYKLINLIKEKFPIVFIDEFQDTDHLQYDIFYNIYIKNNLNNDTKLVLIGDPKQSIYSFRGASILNYIRVKNHVKNFFTLIYNWRSSVFMVNSINILFYSVNSFILKNIKYFPVKFVIKNRHLYISLNKKIQSSLNFFILKDINNKDIISEYCAKRILYILDKKNNIMINNNKKSRYINFSDISVLVHSNIEIEIVSNVFQKFNLPIICLSSKKSVFSTLASKELMYIVRTVLYPEFEFNISNTLSTYIYGINLFDIPDYLNNKIKLNNLVKKFYKYYYIWDKYGFFSMVRLIIDETNILNKIYFSNDGNRYISNLLHVSEILQKKSFEFRNKISLLNWFNKKIINCNYEKNKEFKVRSYNDNNDIINISTIHKSKGLQYNVVFLPFLINFTKKNDKNLFFMKYIYKKKISNINNEKEINKKIVNELLSEEIRLLYVAITRSIYQCNIFIYNLKFKGQENSSLYKLLISNKNFNFIKIKNNLLNELNKKYISFIICKNKYFSDKLYYEIKHLDVNFLNKKKKKKKKNKIGIYNYSNIFIKINNNLIEKNYLDKINFNDFSILDNINNFYKGEKVGNFFHSLLEKINFKNKIDINFINLKLNEFGYDIKWNLIIKKTLFNVLNVKLDLININLIDENINILLKEFEFLMKIKSKFNLIKYLNISKKYDYISNICLNFKIDDYLLSGYLNGIIDLIFLYNNKYYIIDYKSNWIGHDYKFYNEYNLINEICNHRYDIQYQLYTVALHNYLKNKIYNYNYINNFGGIYYIFLRGLYLNKYNYSKTGIFYIKPNFKLINYLSNLF